MDAKTYARGLMYFQEGRVQPLGRDGDVLHARVRGRQPTPYQVTVGLDALPPTGTSGGLPPSSTTSCTCGWGGTCKHVEAVLLAWRADPGAFPTLDAGPAPNPAAVRAWAERHDAVHLLETPLRDVLRTYVPRHLEDTVGAYLYGPDARGLGREQEQRRREVVRWLVQTAKAHKASREHARDAESWRSVEPPEAALVPLWRWLRDVTRAPRTTLGHTAVIRADQLVIDGDPPAVVVHLGYRHASVRVAPVAGDPAPDRLAADAVLDLIGHPSLREAPIRSRLVLEASRPPWDRAMAALDRAIGLADRRPAGHDETRQFGWKVELKGVAGLRVEPTWFWPYARKEGLRTQRCELRDVPGDLPQDRLLADMFARTRPYDPGVGLVALHLLVGHPSVVLGEISDRVEVYAAELELHWHPTADGGVRAEPRVLGVALDAAGLERVLDSTSGHHALWVDAVGRRLAVLSLSQAALRLLRELEARGTTWPAEAVGALLARVPDLGRLLPVRLHGDLRGEEVAGDPLPVVRMSPRADGGLAVDVRLRPLDPGPNLVPGEGPDEVSAVRDGRRIYIVRERSTEVARVEAALEPLRLPPTEGFSWRLDDPEVALDLVHALRSADAAAGLRVEWSGKAPHVTTPADARMLRLRAAEEPRFWFALKGEVEVEGEVLPLGQLLGAIREQRRYVNVREGVWVSLAQRLFDRLAELAALSWQEGDDIALAPLAASVLAGVEEDGASVELPASWRAREARLRESATVDVTLPEGLHAELRPYQREGFEWLARLAHWAPGAVLADDMGLGKTVQSLALLLRRAELGPTLVVAPASVEINWEREAARFAPSLRVVRYRGPKRGKLLAELGPGAVLIASWALLRRDTDALAEVPWGTVVLDEAHAIKTPTAAQSRASARLQPPFTLALTGTPVENHAVDLWSLFRTVVPGLLGPLPVFASRLRESLTGSQTDARAAVAAVIRPFVLRRLKRDVALDLPPRTEIVVPIELSLAERRRYEEFRASAELAKLSAEQKDQMLLLAALTRLRQLACATRLVDPELTEPSTKLERLVEILRDLKAEGHRALVFSQFTTLLDYAREALEAAGITVLTLDGSTPVQQRMVEVDAFQRGHGDAFLISLKAGGVGLNLTGASYVVHLDPWWNPAAEDQATDRAHRIGQTLPVTVLKLVAVDTIEEEVLLLHHDKRKLVRDLLAGTDSRATLTPDALLALLRGTSSPEADEALPR